MSIANINYYYTYNPGLTLYKSLEVVVVFNKSKLSKELIKVARKRGLW